jgi:hypothetical protein
VAIPAPGLDDDEPVVTRMTVAFRGSFAASTRGLGFMSSRARLKSFNLWADHADDVGFPVAKPEMVLGVTNRRLVVWRPSFWIGRPTELVGTIPFENIIHVEVYRAGPTAVLVFGFRNGEFVEVESMRARPMRDIRDAVRAHL